MEGRFDSYRTTLGKSGGIKTRFFTAWDELQQSRKNGYNKTIILIVAVLIFLFLWMIDFDLSIFTGQEFILTN